jgi:lipoprotein-releasing system ATP-binding protein
MGDPKAVLRLSDVCKQFPSLDGAPPVQVLQHVSLELNSGDSLAIVGPSGSGKSTLLNIIGTLDRPSQGQVYLDGQEVSGLDDLHLAAVRNRQIGFVFQSHHLLPQCTVLENVLVPTIPVKDPAFRARAEQRARSLLERVGLGQRLSHRPGQLSGGERQRTAVVRALVNEPKLLLADEPTGALDRHASLELAQLLIELNREQGVTLVVVTHALDLADRMQRALELRDGSLSERSPAHDGA